ncbi:MAG: DUF3572 family protein [Alphaproteobacteria bacterium]|nr:DUF3572 family protein [Alphaproteobacteria bacterium]
MVHMRKFSFEEIKALAHEALLDIFDDPYRQQRFFALTGATPRQIRRDMHRPEFIAAILDYILQDEPFLKEFADHQDLNPAAITLARLRLPGAPMSE